MRTALSLCAAQREAARPHRFRSFSMKQATTKGALFISRVVCQRHPSWMLVLTAALRVCVSASAPVSVSVSVHINRYGGKKLLIGVTEPRRIAAISVAARVAEELNLSSREVSHQVQRSWNWGVGEGCSSSSFFFFFL